MQESNSKSLFERPIWVSFFALVAAIAWGWAYPLIKLGFAEFFITAEMTGCKILFAGIRFLISGCIILVMARCLERSFQLRHRSDWWYVLLFALVNTTIHYACFYIGLSHSMGSRAAILNSLSVFSVVILACIFFKSDRMTIRKIIGCLTGFAGIIVLNMDGIVNNTGASFTLLGDGMIIMNAMCGATASLLTRGLSRRVDVFVGTGYALAIGGGLLTVAGLLSGGYLPEVTREGCIYLFLLVCISTIGFALYNKLLSCNPVGKVAIFNSLIPVVGAVSSCICLDEPFNLLYVFAGTLAATGIYVINVGKK